MTPSLSAFVLGTAMWGWTIEPAECHRILDAYYEGGGRWIDGATNYPINKQAEDFRKAEQILFDWIKTRGIDDLKVIMKVGSINNLGGSENNLSPSFLLLCAQEYQHMFGRQLQCLMIHWDNRSDRSEIAASLDALQNLEGVEMGLSGIRHPELYAEVLEDLNLDPLWLQLKHNVIYSDYERYRSLHRKVLCIAYGINAGGLKLDPSVYSDRASLLARGGKHEQYQELVQGLQGLVQDYAKMDARPALQKMNHLGLLYALSHPGIEKVLLGVSSVEQLKDSLAWEQVFKAHDYSDWFVALGETIQQYKRT